MERMQFTTRIDAPVSSVHALMIGRETFKQWTSVFNPSSEYESDVEGSWQKGSKIRFMGIDADGKRGGMVGYIRENIPGKQVSIEYVGIVEGENEITEGPVADEWKGFENYTFSDNNGATRVTVDIDVNDQMKDYFRDTYPRALAKLKEICEQR